MRGREILWTKRLILQEMTEEDFPALCKILQDEEVIYAYLFQKKFWHQGYAAEAAIACREYAFEKWNAPKVYSIIRDSNLASQKVARRNGMEITGQFVKHYHGFDMPHDVFAVSRRVETAVANDIRYNRETSHERKKCDAL